MLLGGGSGQGLEPVGEVGGAALQRPLLHRDRDRVGQGRRQGLALGQGALKLLEEVVAHALALHCRREYVVAEGIVGGVGEVGGAQGLPVRAPSGGSDVLLASLEHSGFCLLNRARRPRSRGARCDWIATNGRRQGSPDRGRRGCPRVQRSARSVRQQAERAVRWPAMGSVDVNGAMGRVGLPEPIAELAARDWDAVVVGGGHNGLTAAAYLAQAGRSVLVLERREQLGGACTLERPFEDEGYVVSPCAYAVGLLDERVVRRAGAEAPRLPGLSRPTPASGARSPMAPRSRSFATASAPAPTCCAQGFAEREVEGLLAYEHAYDRCRVALRKGERDAWVGSSPSREELEGMLGGDEELIGDRVRGVGRGHARALRQRPEAGGRAVRAGDHRHRRGPARPRHRLDPADARAGRARGPRVDAGATSRAAWAGSRSRSPRPRGRRGRRWPPASRWRASCPARGWSWRAAS